MPNALPMGMRFIPLSVTVCSDLQKFQVCKKEPKKYNDQKYVVVSKLVCINQVGTLSNLIVYNVYGLRASDTNEIDMKSFNMVN